MSYLDTYLGQLDAGLSNPAVMELAINADGSIWVERAGQIHMTASGLPALPARAVRSSQLLRSAERNGGGAVVVSPAAPHDRHRDVTGRRAARMLAEPTSI